MSWFNKNTHFYSNFILKVSLSKKKKKDIRFYICFNKFIRFDVLMFKQNVKLTLSAVVSVRILNYFTFSFITKWIKWKISRFKDKMKHNVTRKKKRRRRIYRILRKNKLIILCKNLDISDVTCLRKKKEILKQVRKLNKRL